MTSENYDSLRDFMSASNMKLGFSHHLNPLWGYVRLLLEAKYNDEYISLHFTFSLQRTNLAYLSETSLINLKYALVY